MLRRLIGPRFWIKPDVNTEAADDDTWTVNSCPQTNPVDETHTAHTNRTEPPSIDDLVIICKMPSDFSSSTPRDSCATVPTVPTVPTSSVPDVAAQTDDGKDTATEPTAAQRRALKKKKAKKAKMEKAAAAAAAYIEREGLQKQLIEAAQIVMADNAQIADNAQQLSDSLSESSRDVFSAEADRKKIEADLDALNAQMREMTLKYDALLVQSNQARLNAADLATRRAMVAEYLAETNKEEMAHLKETLDLMEASFNDRKVWTAEDSDEFLHVRSFAFAPALSLEHSLTSPSIQGLHLILMTSKSLGGDDSITNTVTSMAQKLQAECHSSRSAAEPGNNSAAN